MKSTIKTALTISLLLPLAGCWDCCSAKKNAETTEVATHAQVTTKKTSKCSHKGCTHDHSKDTHTEETVVVVPVEAAEVVENDSLDMQSMNDDETMDDVK